MSAANFSVDIRVSEGGYTKKGNLRKGAVDWRLTSDLNGEQTLADVLNFTKRALINIATDALAEEKGRGFDPKPVVIVDGKFNRREEEVHPLGRIQYVARASMREMILETFEMIKARSRDVTGEYVSHNVVTFNGAEIARTRSQLETWLDNKDGFQSRDKIRFVNTAPYARKLERYAVTNSVGGKRARQRHKKKDRKRASGFMNRGVQIPNGTYALTYKHLKKKYGKNSFLKFDMVDGRHITLPSPDINRKTSEPFRRSYATGRDKGRPYFYPSILISAVEAGITDGKLQ